MAEPEQEADIVEVEPPEHKLVERFGALLRQRRIALGMHQNDLALASGVGRRFIIDLEAGKASCQIGKALLVAEALGIKILELIEETGVRGSHTLHVQPATVRITGQEVRLMAPGDRPAESNAAEPDLPDDLEEPAP